MICNKLLSNLKNRIFNNVFCKISIKFLLCSQYWILQLIMSKLFKSQLRYLVSQNQNLEEIRNKQM